MVPTRTCSAPAVPWRPSRRRPGRSPWSRTARWNSTTAWPRRSRRWARCGGRGAAEDKVTVVMDGGDEDVVRRGRSVAPGPATSGTFTLVSHGTVEQHYGLDTVIEAVAVLREEIPGLRLRIYGDGSHLP